MSLGARRRRPPTPGFVANELWRRAGAVPSFHIAPARTQNARDLITGSVLGTYNSASPAWAVGPDGVLALPAANAPVIEYDPVTLQCLGARIWGVTTNSHIYSEDATQWLTPTNLTLTANQGTAPSNVLAADRYIETTTNGLHAQDGSAFSFVSGTQYTYSVFVESIGGRNFEIGYPAAVAGASTRFARFNLAAGTVQGTDAGITGTIIPYPGGRFRCAATVTATTSVSARVSNFINDASFSRVYAGDTSKGLFIWGAQINTGPLAPYVPTGATAASSTADVWSITGADFSRIWNQSAVTFYAEAVRDVVPGGEFPVLIDARTTNSLEIAQISYLIEPVAGMFARTSAGIQAELYPAVGGRTRRVAAAFAQDNFATCANGGTVLTDSSGIMPSPDRINLGSVAVGQFLNGYIREAATFRSRRPNANIQAMIQ